MKKSIKAPELKAVHMRLERGDSLSDEDRFLALESRIMDLEKQVSSQKGVLTKTRNALKGLLSDKGN